MNAQLPPELEEMVRLAHGLHEARTSVTRLQHELKEALATVGRLEQQIIAQAVRRTASRAAGQSSAPTLGESNVPASAERVQRGSRRERFLALFDAADIVEIDGAVQSIYGVDDAAARKRLHEVARPLVEAGVIERAGGVDRWRRKPQKPKGAKSAPKSSPSGSSHKEEHE